jgi:hypothetical protein
VKRTLYGINNVIGRPEAEDLRIPYVQIGDGASGTFEPFSGVDNIANRIVKMSRSL